MNDQTNAPAISRDQLIANWQKARTELKKATHTEMHYRLAIVRTFFPDLSNDEEGTRNYQLGNDWKLKAVFKLNYSIDNKLVDGMLQTLEKAGPDGSFIANRIIKWSPSLSLSEYRELPPQYKNIVDSILTIKPATPSLELVEPKT